MGYDFFIEHIPGKQNFIADALSRLFPMSEELINHLESLNIIVENDNMTIE